MHRNAWPGGNGPTARSLSIPADRKVSTAGETIAISTGVTTGKTATSTTIYRAFDPFDFDDGAGFARDSV